MSMYEKTIRRETVYRGIVVNVELQDVELETGQRAKREIVRHVAAVALIVRRPGDRFLFIRQFRKPAEAILVETVAGVLDKGEDPETGARRELAEETGYTAKGLVHLGHVYPSPGYIDEKIDIFLADVDGAPGERDLDHDERVEVFEVGRDEVSGMIRRGEIVDSKTLAAWTLYLHHKESV